LRWRKRVEYDTDWANVDVGKAVGAGIVGALAAVACLVSVFVLPNLFAFLIVTVSTHGPTRAALRMIVVALASWLFDLSLGSLLLAWFAATTIGAVIGGCVGAFMGYLTAAFVLRRASTDEVDLEA
jgi:hypothetical protein